MREFSVLVGRDQTVEGVWWAHCLNWDVVTQGDSPATAIKSIIEAIELVIASDEAEGLDPDDRTPAPEQCWEEFVRTRDTGRRVNPVEVERLGSSGARSIAMVMYRLSKQELSSRTMKTPPPFMIAALERHTNPAYC